MKSMAYLPGAVSLSLVMSMKSMTYVTWDSYPGGDPTPGVRYPVAVGPP